MQIFYIPCLLILPGISAWTCILQENDSVAATSVLNVFDIESTSNINSTCCRIRLTNYSSDSSLCFMDKSVSKLKGNNFRVFGRVYPPSNELDVTPVNAVCMKGELLSCTEVDNHKSDLKTIKSAKHRRKTLLETYEESLSNDVNSSEIDIQSYQADQGFQDVIMVAPTLPSLSSDRDIQVEYQIGEEVKLACLLEAKPSNEIIWMKDDIIIENPEKNFIDYQTQRIPIASNIVMDIFKITVNSANASGLYTCYLKNSSSLQKISLSFQIIATSSMDYAEYKFKKPNITGFILGMIPSIILFFYIIMSLGYRSRYAMDQEEEEEQGLGI